MPLSNIKIHRSGPEMLNELIGRLPTSDLERWALKTARPPFLLQLATPRSMESTMNPERLFKVTEFLQPADGEPIRSVITESADAAVVAWYVKPGQSISAHMHPDGQDTWTILSGCGEYSVSSNGESIAIAKGDVLVAHRREVHGVHNTGQEPLVFVSVVSPAASGFEPV
jgi:quercetin dioxygenase-like cupin family protein